MEQTPDPESSLGSNRPTFVLTSVSGTGALHKSDYFRAKACAHG